MSLQEKIRTGQKLLHGIENYTGGDIAELKTMIKMYNEFINKFDVPMIKIIFKKNKMTYVK